MEEEKKLPEAILSFRIVEVIYDRDNRLSRLGEPVSEKEKEKEKDQSWQQP